MRTLRVIGIGLGDPGQLVEAHHIAGDHDFGVAGNAEIGPDIDPPRAVLGGAGGLRHPRPDRR